MVLIHFLILFCCSLELVAAPAAAAAACSTLGLAVTMNAQCYHSAVAGVATSLRRTERNSIAEANEKSLR